MPLDARTVSISLRYPGTAPGSAVVTFYPDFAVGDGQVLLEEAYTVTVNTPSGTDTLTGSVTLPVKTDTSKAVAYRVKFPRETGYNEHYIYLSKGNPNTTIQLSQLLIDAATVNNWGAAELSLDDLSDVVTTSPTAGEYLKYDGSNWVNSSVSFTSITLNDAYITTNSLGVASTTADQAIMSLSATLYRSVKYLVQVVSGSDIHVSEIRVFHDGTTCSIAEYGVAYSGSSLASFSADITGGNIRLLTTPTVAPATFKVLAQAIEV